MRLMPLVAALAAALPAFAELETYTVDPAHTRPTYEVSHFGYSMQRGRFNKASGKITLDIAKSATGDLTLNGVTRPVTLTATQFQCAPHPMNKKKQCGADLVTTIKRSDFGMKYALPALGDDVTLRIPVESIKD